MAGRRRLLAVCLLVFITIHSILAAQDGAADRAPAEGRVVVPIVAPHLLPRHDPLPPAPVWIPAPLPQRSFPVVAGNPGLPPDVFQQLIRTPAIIFSPLLTSAPSPPPPPRPAHPSTPTPS